MKNKKIIIFLILILTGIKSSFSQVISPYLGTGHNTAVTDILFAKKGSLLITCDKNNKVIIWNFFERKEINNIVLAKKSPLQIINDSVLYCKDAGQYLSLPLLNVLPAYTMPDNSAQPTFSIVNKGDRLKLYKQNSLIVTIPKMKEDFTGDAINADETYMAHVCGDNYLIYRSLKQPKNFEQINTGENIVQVAFHSVIPQLVVVGTQRGDIKIFDIKTGEHIFTLSNDLIRPLFVTEDLNKKNIIINEDNNAYVFDYHNLFLNQYNLPFGKLKKNEAYIQVYNDTLNKNNFYFWKNNYKLYNYSGDDKPGVTGYGVTKYHDNYVKTGAAIIPLLSNPVNLFVFLGNIDNAHLYRQTASFQAQKDVDVTYSINGKVIIKDGDRKKIYRSVGTGATIFTQDDSTILTLRDPSYLNVIDKNEKFKPQNYYLFDKNIEGLYTLRNSLFVLQNPGSFRLLQCSKNQLSVKQVLTGEYINANAAGSEFYYKKDSNVVIHDFSEQKESFLTTRKDHNVLFVKQLTFDNTVYGYLIFYDIGMIEYRSSDNKLIGTYYCYNSGEFIFMLPDNSFYSTSKTLVQKVLLKNNNGIYQLDQFEAKYNRPDLVMRKMEYIDSEKLKIFDEAYSKYITRYPVNKDIAVNNLPQAEIMNWNDNYFTKDSVATIHCRFRGNNNKLDKINVYINSVPVFGKQGIELTNRQISSFDTTFTITLNKGDNLVKPIVISANGTKNFVKSYYVKADYATTQRVYFLGIGANKFTDAYYNLNYADKDIQSLVKTLKDRYGNALSVDTLFDQQVNSIAIQQSLARLKNVNINDKVIIYYSGHGLLSKNGDYYLSGYNVNFKEPQDGGIFYENVENMIDAIPSRYKIFFIDACNAGELESKNIVIKGASEQGKKGIILDGNKRADNSFYLMQDIFSDFSQGSGTIIISASRGNQPALEDKKWGHGAFTYSILQGLEGNKADLNRDNKISISELKSYVSHKVIEITNGEQRPTARKDVLDYDWVF